MATPVFKRVHEEQVILERHRIQLPQLEVTFAVELIHTPVAWRIQESSHVVVVHLGGRMDRLETELEGHGGSSGPALPGEIWTVPAGQAYAGQSQGGVIRYAELRLDPEAFGPMVPVAGVSNEALHRAVRRLEAAFAADGSRLSSEIEGAGLLEGLAASLAVTGGRPGIGTGLDGQTCRRVKSYIHDKLADDLTLGELSLHAGLSCHRFLSAFRRSFGVSPWQYVIRQRVRNARRMLESTDLDLTSIALASGFYSHSHLTTSFRKCLGMTPSRYRESRR